MINKIKDARSQVLSSSSNTLVYDFNKNWVIASIFRTFM